jgi:hypothetical protein
MFGELWFANMVYAIVFTQLRTQKRFPLLPQLLSLERCWI